VTRTESWAKVEFWVQELLSHEKNCLVVLAGTKVDLLGPNEEGRQVSKDMVEQFARGINAVVIETSAKDNFKVTDLFVEAVKAFMERNGGTLGRIDSGNRDAFPVDGTPAPASGGCQC